MKGWKTITLAVLVALVGFFEALQGIIPENVIGYLLIGLGTVIGLLRAITTTSIFKK